MTNDVIREQIEYYRARANEYDEWFYRLGRYSRDEELNSRWLAEVDVLMRAVDELGPADDVLELACGTGIWTEQLLKMGKRITAIDASPEVIEINRRKLNEPRNVRYEQHDLFAWEPTHQYDLVFVGFWLSHVPPELLDAFLGKVAMSVRTGGKVFVIDSLHDPTSTSTDSPLREDEHIYRTRKLKSGQEFKIVKVFYDPAELEEKLASSGFDASIKTTDHYFLYGGGVKR